MGWSIENEGGKLPSNYGGFLNAMADKEAQYKRTAFKKSVPGEKFSNTLHERENYDFYLFRTFNFGRLMGGVPKPLTANQQDTYKAYHDRYMGIGKPLTEKQEFDYFDLGKKLRAKVQLSEGAKTFCEELVREDIFGRSRILETKYMDKGIEMEQASINLYSKFVGLEFVKNTERKTNDYWSGEADNVQFKIRDFKTSWDHSTFPRAAIEIPSLYEWQLQVYMDLYGFEEAELVYCLVDTPVRLVMDELRRLDWKYDIMTVDGNIREEHIPFVVERVCNMVYTLEGLGEVCDQSGILELDWFCSDFIELPIEKRIKAMTTHRDDKMISQGKEMIELAREYMNLIAKS